MVEDAVEESSPSGEDVAMPDITEHTDVPPTNGEDHVTTPGPPQTPSESEIPPRDNASPTPSSKSASDSLRRTSSKIANLRAAFESRTVPNADPMPRRRFEKSPVRPHEYEADIARLKDQLEKETELRQAYEEKCTILEESNEELSAKLVRRDKVWEGEVQREHGILLQEKLQAQEDAHNAHRQLTELKRGIAAATHIESQVTDATFASEMGILHSEVQNWTVQHFRRTKMDVTAEALDSRVDTIADEKQKEFLKPVFGNFDATSKLAFLQTTIVSYLMDAFEDPLLFGLTTQQEWYSSLKATAELLPSVLTPVAFNKWRAVTLNSVRQSESVKEAIDAAALELAERICAALGKITNEDEHESRVASLRTITKRGISLAHLFRVQRAQYSFLLPASGAQFDDHTMENISIDGEAQETSAILCATFPSVKKLGDENGDNLQLTGIVLRSKVLHNDDR